MLTEQKPDLVFLSETLSTTTMATNIIQRFGLTHSTGTDVLGRSGGMIAAWNDTTNISVIDVSQHWIHLKGKDLKGMEFLISFVYGPPQAYNRGILWNNLLSFGSSITYPWLIMGDFNQLIHASEKLSKNTHLSGVENFVNIINSCNMIDLLPSGNWFTWCNGRNGDEAVWERLDRVLVNPEWLNTYADSNVKALPIYASDHAPLIYSSYFDLPHRYRPRRFEAMWMMHSEYITVVDKAWNTHVNGSNAFKLCCKLKNVMNALYEWNKTSFGNIKFQIQSRANELAHIQKQIGLCNSEELLTKELQLRKELECWLDREEVMWAQKTKQLWLLNGDRNTKYFQTIAVYENESNMAIQDILNKIHHLNIPALNERQRQNLLEPISMPEVEEAVFNIKAFKSPGPDGFPAAFFHKHWEKCVNTVEYTLLLNGQKVGKFKPERGLRQGDPLSPFLFIIASNMLSVMLHNAENKKGIKGIQFNNKGPQITHLMFADDTVLFFKADSESKQKLRNLLQEYCEMAGQKVNRNKSLLVFSPNTPTVLKEEFRDEWGIAFRNDLGKYLGTYVDGRINSRSIFEELLEKIQSRLAGWKSKLISQAGRVTLINSVLQALPIYQMSNIELPKKVVDKIDSITNDFFWGTKGNRKRIHLLSSKVLRQPRWEGGLGIKNIKLFNEALIPKNVWRLVERPNALCSRWFLEKYQNPNMELDFKSTSQDSLYWKSIIRNKSLVIDNLQWTVGNGEYIRTNSNFWPFQARNSNQDILLADLIIQDDNRRWDINALQGIYSRNEVNEISKILLPRHNCPDILTWRFNNQGNYTVKEGYKFLQIKTGTQIQLRKEAFPFHGRRLYPIFLTCDFSRAVWFGINTAFRSSDLQENVQNWIQEICIMAKSKLIDNIDLLRIFTTLENIWFCRNKKLMENIGISPINCIHKTEQQVKNYIEASRQWKNHIYQMECQRNPQNNRLELIEPDCLAKGISFSIIKLRVKERRGWLGIYCTNGHCKLITIFWPKDQWNPIKSITRFLWRCMVQPSSKICNFSILNLPAVAKELELKDEKKASRSENHNILREIKGEIIKNKIAVNYCNSRWVDIAKVNMEITLPLQFSLSLLLLLLSSRFSSAQVPGFFSLDCGGKENFTDELGLDWISDDRLPYGETSTISVASETRKQYTTLRHFPADSRKYCYTLNVASRTRYLLRASFLYGNFDDNNVYPKFDISFGATFWSTIVISDANTIETRELIFLATDSTISVCLSHATTGQPFISTLELRQFNGSVYHTDYEEQFYLSVSARVNFGAESDAPIRYPDDPFDRIWESDSIKRSNYLVDVADGTQKVSTEVPIDVNSNDMPPVKVMQTAVVGTKGSLTYRLNLDGFPGFGWAFAYFAEIENLASNESRKFRLVVPGQPDISRAIVNIEENAQGRYRLYEPGFTNLSLPFVFSFKIGKSSGSTRGPLLNALEINKYLKKSDGSQDGEAISGVISRFSSADLGEEGGDPCLPVPWSWVRCNSDPQPRIVSILLSSKNLTGNIPSDITKLTGLVELWLDGNMLTGPIPDFTAVKDLKIIHLENNQLTDGLPASLVNLPKLTKLYVQNNMLSGKVPSDLLTRDLVLNYSGNINLHKESRKNNLIYIIIGSSVGAIILVLLAIASCLFLHKGKRINNVQDGHRSPISHSMATVSSGAPTEAARCFSLSELENATSNFGKKIGSGGFGVVYYGKLRDGTEIAVKVLTNDSCQVKREFSNEVALLSRIHHRHLVQFLGYCRKEGKNMLVYEFMHNGTLKEHLIGRPRRELKELLNCPSRQSINSWIKRLEIAEDAAKGIEYLHTGCVPAVIHRDLKSSNILLDKDMGAKVSDFGLSKVNVDEASHVSSLVRGTIGYLDPEYYTSHQLNDKSDVYSFGIILLELISGREVISRESFGDNFQNIIQWAKSRIEDWDIQGIIDPSLGDEYDLQSVRKISKIAFMCVQSRGRTRPSISKVLKEIQDAISIERIKEDKSHEGSRRLD
ncbi:putative LRR receptor-like serine/threonine-protein kinase [Senna tora]|uniref:Putative LRR receptor-like serine/threonine-protein kinase n=1 Tax=Senna tora TaxID=362788 RepID=A0A834SL01_9FABA|nr:putative LRR receptor-like serine/threonine-protein kinase [Senna tora]